MAHEIRWKLDDLCDPYWPRREFGMSLIMPFNGQQTRAFFPIALQAKTSELASRNAEVIMTVEPLVTRELIVTEIKEYRDPQFQPGQHGGEGM